MKNPLLASAPLVALVLLAAAAPGCTSASIYARELFGQEKREQLVSNVEQAREEQQEAKETFSSALDELLSISSGNATTDELEAQYRRIQSAYERSEAKAQAVRSRIDRVQAVADRLFEEWESELDEYENQSLRGQSQVQLAATKQRYEQLIAAMRRAAARMDPVLTAFKDQTLFLKHNLNAQAIASLESDLAEIRVDVGALIEEMEAAIEEADTFIESIRGG